MTKDVLISISGAHISNGDQEEIEVITAGDYYMKNGKHYILYDEVAEGVPGVIKNTIKVLPDSMDIIKRGPSDTHMIFERNKKNTASYLTPMGELIVGISTNQISVVEEENLLQVVVDYSLDINYERISDCNIVVEVRPKEYADLHLQS